MLRKQTWCITKKVVEKLPAAFCALRNGSSSLDNIVNKVRRKKRQTHMLQNVVKTFGNTFLRLIRNKIPEMEFKEFEPRLKSAKTRFKLSAGKWNQPYLNPGLNLNRRSNSLNSATGFVNNCRTNFFSSPGRNQ